MVAAPSQFEDIRFHPGDPRFVVILLLVAGLLAVPFFGGGYLLPQITKVLILAIAAASLDLLVGYGGLVSFGHAAFLGVGGYAVAIWATQGAESALLHFLSAAAGAAVLGWLIGAVCLRTSGLYFIMITFAFAQMLYFLGVSLEPLGGDDGVNVRASQIAFFGHAIRLSEHGGRLLYFLTLGILIAVIFFLRRLVNSRFGFVLRGCRSNETRMMAIGFPTFRYRLAAFVISAVICSVAGALLASQQQFVSPSYMGWLRSGELLVMVILGGLGTIYGSVLGAMALIALEEIFIAYAGKDYWMMVLGPVLILIVIYARRGLLSFLPAYWGQVGPFLVRAAVVAFCCALFLACINFAPTHLGISALHVVLWPIALLVLVKSWLHMRRRGRHVLAGTNAKAAS